MRTATTIAIALLAGTFTASPITFLQAVDSITANNPEIIKSRMECDLARAEIKSAGALSDPELVGEYMWLPKGVDNRWNVGFEWGFDWFEVYGARRREAKAQADAFEVLAESTELSQRQVTIEALINWQLQNQRLALLEKMAAANGEMLKLSQSRVKQGQISQLDANKIAIEVGRFSIRIEDERQAMIESVRILSQLAGGKDVYKWLNDLNDDFIADKPLPDLKTILLNAKRLPAVRAALAQTEAARRAVATARAERGPGLTFGYKHLFEDGMHFNGVSLGITIPAFSNRGKVEAAKLKQVQAEFEFAATKRQEEIAAIALWQQAEKLRKCLEPLRQVFTTTDNFKLLTQRYQAGEISLHEYQEDKLYFMEAQLEYLDLQARYRKALNDLIFYL